MSKEDDEIMPQTAEHAAAPFPAATAPPGAPRMAIELNPYHPLSQYQEVVIPGSEGRTPTRTAILPAGVDTLPIDDWARLLARHVSRAAVTPRLTVDTRFTVNLADPRQTALLEQVRQSPQADRILVRTYATPSPPAPETGLTWETPLETPEAARAFAKHLDRQFAEEAGAETPSALDRRAEADFAARFHPSERAAKEYTGSYFGVILSQDDEEFAKADRAYQKAHQDEFAEIRQAQQYSRQFRLVEVAPDQWALWRLGPRDEPFDHGYFLAQQGQPATPWRGSWDQALDHLEHLVARRYPALAGDGDVPTAERADWRREWTRRARHAADVAPAWQRLFEAGHTAAVVRESPALQTGRRWRLVEIKPRSWAIWRLAPPGQPFDCGYFLSASDHPGQPWAGSWGQALDRVTQQVTKSQAGVSDAAVHALRRQWTREARKAPDVAPAWRRLFLRGHTAAAALERVIIQAAKPNTPGVTTHGPRL